MAQLAYWGGLLWPVGVCARVRVRGTVKMVSPSYPLSNIGTLFSLITNRTPVFCLRLPPTPRSYTVRDQAPRSTSLLSFMSDAAVSPDPLLLRDSGSDPFCPSAEGLTCRTRERSRDRAAADAPRLQPGASPPQRKFAPLCSSGVSGIMENHNTHLALGSAPSDLVPAPANVAVLLGPPGSLPVRGPRRLYQVSSQRGNRLSRVARSPPGLHSAPGESPFPPERHQASCLKAIWNWRFQTVIFRTAQLLCFSALIFELIEQKEVAAWTYNYSTKAYSWNYSRMFCQKHYTDLVAIQNKKEIAYLNDVMPYFNSYYWIGIRRINDKWTWVGTKKVLTKEAENWADNEPNNKKNNQDCVEIYIKSVSAPGKWNDEPCWKKKRALCYTASCQDMSCSKQGECIETIGNYTCSCFPGFYGPECEYVQECGEFGLPQHVLMNCSHPLGNFSFNSECSFHCAEGYELKGPSKLKCLASGMWTNNPPQCIAAQCPPLKTPERGSMTCLPSPEAPQYQSSCHFACEEGFALVGPEVVQCTASGVWTASPPGCEVVRCPLLEAPGKGTMDCVHPLTAFAYGSSCKFECEPGYQVRGRATLRCIGSGQWTTPLPACEAIACEPLESPVHGSTDCSPLSGPLPYNTSCSFRCADGFRLKGADMAQCTDLGRWTAPAPVCEGVVSAPLSEVRCPALTTLEQGTVSCRHGLGTFGPNTTCYFGCHAGFTLTGGRALRCRPSGQWTAGAPTCRAVKCSELHGTEPGTMNCSNPWGNFSYGSTCSFHCPEGQLLNGSARTACQENGQWSTPMPTCQAGPLTIQEALTYFGGAVASTIGLVTCGTLLALLRKRFRQKDDGESPLNPQSHLGTYGVFTNAAFDPSP
ncbi:P-selectin isoform X12 [Felis catus]|uniref:P-selectin isoform X12 n=1 Tax=Felis catus TaxID=9685 RepID=UPI001D1A0AF8|nr:P-selectin isoform X12 [Felis catus]